VNIGDVVTPGRKEILMPGVTQRQRLFVPAQAPYQKWIIQTFVMTGSGHTRENRFK
jgi:hypothetical protein